MTGKSIKEIKTSCPFPLLIYGTNLHYYEVRKASGIAYILLEMIDKATDPKDTISDVLLKFGIPAELHYLFGKEIAGLIGTEIVKADYPASFFTQPRYFSQIKMGEIELTSKGRTMFREKAIPTGQEKVKRKDIYFDPVTRKFDVVFPLPHADISTSALGEEFIDKLDLDVSGMGDYIQADPTKMGLKAEEKISSFETGEPQKRAVKPEENLTIALSSTEAEFRFSTSNEQAFFNRYFSSELLEHIMQFKPRYRFTDGAGNPVKVPTIPVKELHATNFFIPDDLAKLAKTPCRIFLGRGRFNYDRYRSALSIEREEAIALLDDLDANIEFALLDTSGCRYYQTLNVSFPCPQFQDVFEMPLVAENQAPLELFRRTVRKLFDLYKAKPFSSGCSEGVAYAVETLKDGELFEEYAEEQLSKISAVDGKIEHLIAMNSAFSKISEWKPRFMRLAEELYSESVKEVRLDTMIYKNAVLSPLVKAMGMTVTDHITRFSEAVRNEEPSLVYQALSSAGFEPFSILGIVNVVELYARSVLNGETILADDELASEFSVLQANFNKLNDMLGIVNLSEYTIKEDYNIDDFFNAYGTFESRYRALGKYKRYAEKEFRELEGYKAIYDPVHELLSIEETAASHPENITRKYIDEHISRGRYRNAICDLLVKLQFDLRKILQADAMTKANELIDMAREEGVIDGKEADMLHKLRICRNRLQHPNAGEARFDHADIERWRNIVFSIGGNQ